MFIRMPKTTKTWVPKNQILPCWLSADGISIAVDKEVNCDMDGLLGSALNSSYLNAQNHKDWVPENHFYPIGCLFGQLQIGDYWYMCVFMQHWGWQRSQMWYGWLLSSVWKPETTNTEWQRTSVILLVVCATITNGGLLVYMCIYAALRLTSKFV